MSPRTAGPHLPKSTTVDFTLDQEPIKSYCCNIERLEEHAIVHKQHDVSPSDQALRVGIEEILRDRRQIDQLDGDVLPRHHPGNRLASREGIRRYFGCCSGQACQQLALSGIWPANQDGTPCALTRDAQGQPALLVGRGGHHRVPETPRGYSMISLKDGKSIWQYQPKQGMALYNSISHAGRSVWFTYNNEIHVLDSLSGKLLRKIQLANNVTLCSYDEANDKMKMEQKMT